MAALGAALGHAGGQARAALAAAAALPQAPLDLPGPTGESNRLSLHPRGRVLCLGAGAEAVLAQAVQALAAGNAVLAVAAGAPAALAALRGPAGRRASTGRSRPASLGDLPGLALVAAAGPADWLRALRRALARRDGPIVPLETGLVDAGALLLRAASLHRHHRGRRQRQPARGERLMPVRPAPRAIPAAAARAPRRWSASSR